MLNDLARAQLAGFLATIQNDVSKTITPSLLKMFLGQAGVDEIQSLTKELVQSNKDNKSTTGISDGAQRYWRRYKLLQSRAMRAEMSGEKGWETKYRKLSEALRDDFWTMVSPLDHGKFRFNDTAEDEADWDELWENLEARPPLLRMEFRRGFVFEKPRNYAQQEVIGRFLAPAVVSEETARFVEPKIVDLARQYRAQE